MSVASLYDLNATKQPMPEGEAWVFEYQRPDNSRFSVLFVADRAVKVTEGDLYKDPNYAGAAPSRKDTKVTVTPDGKVREFEMTF